MADLTLTYSFTPGTTIASAQVNTNNTNITSYINNRNDGTATWDNMNVTATVSNPVAIKSDQSTTILSIETTAVDGDPILSFKLRGNQVQVIGVDDSDNNFLKFSPVSLNAGVAMQVPDVGNQVQFAVGTILLPGIAFIGEADCGFYLSATNEFSAVNAGVLTATINANNQILFAAGTSSLPSISFIGDLDTGLYHSGANEFVAIAGTVQVFKLNANGQVLHANGSASVPSVGFAGDTDTGLFLTASNQVGIATAGVEVGRFDDSATAANTRFSVWDVNKNALSRVSVGANDSGGSGFKVLRVPN